MTESERGISTAREKSNDIAPTITDKYDFVALASESKENWIMDLY